MAKIVADGTSAWNSTAATQDAALSFWTSLDGTITKWMTLSESGALSLSATTSASSSTVGALTVGNGTAATNVAIGGGNINAGGRGTFGVPASPAGTRLEVYDASDTFSAFIRGAGQTNGVAVGTSGGNLAQINAYNSTFGATQALGLQAQGGALSVGNTGTVATFNGTTASTSTTTGALVVSGGAGFAENVVSGGVVRTGSFTVATLPAAATYPGGMAYVTDANATTRLATVAGGGSNKVMVFSDGTNWLIL